MRVLMWLAVGAVAIGAYLGGGSVGLADVVNCYKFGGYTKACPDCEDVINCGNCIDPGVCEAYKYSICTKTQHATPAYDGNELVQEHTRCWTDYLCGVPDPCEGPCELSHIEIGESGEPVIIEKPGPTCHIESPLEPNEP